MDYTSTTGLLIRQDMCNASHLTKKKKTPISSPQAMRVTIPRP